MQSTLHPTRSLPFTKIIRSTSIEQTISAKLHYASRKTKICLDVIRLSFRSSTNYRLIDLSFPSFFVRKFCFTTPVVNFSLRVKHWSKKRIEEIEHYTRSGLDQLQTSCTNYYILFTWRDKRLVGCLEFFSWKDSKLSSVAYARLGFHVSRAIRVFCPSRPLFSINIIHLEELKRKKLQSRIPASSTSKNFIPALNYPLSVTKEKIVPSISVSAVTNKITTNFRRNIIDPI